MDEFLTEFSSVIYESFDRLNKIAEADSSEPLSPGKWSRKQVLGHLIDSASNNHQRFVRAQLEDNLSLPGYDQTLWVDSQKYEAESWIELVTLWRSYNLHLLHIASAIPAETLGNMCSVAAEEPVTLELLVKDYLRHLKHHLAQIIPPS